MGSLGNLDIESVDVLIVGAGFGAVTLLQKLRARGFNVKCYEKGQRAGGIWYWNAYPGARVDTDTPIYQIFDKELWEDFTFRERYPGHEELRRYFDHVDKKWNVSEHMKYNKNVEVARFDEASCRWQVECSDGTLTQCRWFVPCVGFAARKYTPPFPGLGSFEGEVYHTALWPQYGVNFKGKRVAQIGTGASGIQVIQEIGDTAKHLTIYQRTPNYCLPMNQRKLDEAEEKKKKDGGYYEEEMAKTRNTFAGFTYDFIPKNSLDETPEDRDKTFHKLMVEDGGFKYWLATYQDVLFVQEANDHAYNFWRNQVLQRVKDPKKQELLAPKNPPHPWGVKRPSLEQRFYEVVDQPHVEIIDVNASPIQEVTPKGVRTKDEGVIEVDAIILATGFDAVSGGLAQLQIFDKDGNTIGDVWRNGIRTNTGVAVSGFPNLFFLYGPQAPTAFANGPSCTQYQAEWFANFMDQARQEGIQRIEAKPEAEREWVKRVHAAWNSTLFPKAKSWYQGSNIPGKPVEALNWSGGLPAYLEALQKGSENFQDWVVAK